jgi:hypothetical protein
MKKGYGVNVMLNDFASYSLIVVVVVIVIVARLQCKYHSITNNYMSFFNCDYDYDNEIQAGNCFSKASSDVKISHLVCQVLKFILPEQIPFCTKSPSRFSSGPMREDSFFPLTFQLKQSNNEVNDMKKTIYVSYKFRHTFLSS